MKIIAISGPRGSGVSTMAEDLIAGDRLRHMARGVPFRSIVLDDSIYGIDALATWADLICEPDYDLVVITASENFETNKSDIDDRIAVLMDRRLHIRPAMEGPPCSPLKIVVGSAAAAYHYNKFADAGVPGFVKD